ncbi:MAG TPA: saccharopine dehydrogenase C-terminal domain-containing protein, partial [Chitinophagaceae bacterium]|nr:saccharopine dehydrogenase C-terminal domain-containing protein [Chitinophagaceae bacterium]
IKTDGGEVTSFISHCGGLVADESDDNPWHYKISWNPRNVVMAGKSGALYLDNNETKQLEYEQLFSEKRYVSIPDYKELSWYPNRNSLTYIRTYKLDHCHTFIRTTLRHPDFVYGWKNIILLKLTDEEKRYQTDGKSLMLFFKEHLEHHHLQGWLQEQMYHKLSSTKNLLEDLVTLVTMEGEVKDKVEKGANDFMIINKKGDLKNIDVDTIKTEASVTVANQIHEATTTIKQLLYLGLMDDKTKVNKGLCSAADVLQFALEKKLSLRETDMDLVVMMHDIDYIKEGRKYKMKSTLLLKGENNEETAMAKTVGLPLGLAATLILNGVIKSKGLQIPIHKEIYEPILNELEKHGIHFKEEEIEIE